MKRQIRVHFDDGNTIETCINGTTDKIESYYLGKSFTFGSAADERKAKAVRIEFL